MGSRTMTATLVGPLSRARSAGAALTSVDPTSGERVAVYSQTPTVEVQKRIEAVSAAGRIWQQIPPERRAEHLSSLGDALLGQRDRLAHLMALEIGKPIREGREEVERAAALCRWIAEAGPGILRDRLLIDGGRRQASSWMVHRPLGVVLAVLPWNFPVWQLVRSVVPQLQAGNAVAIKHSERVTGCALELAEIFRQSLPHPVVQLLLLDGPSTLAVIDNPRIAAVSMTGSRQAGAAVAQRAGAAIKKTVLELGGNDAVVVLEDADVERAARLTAAARLRNCGQSCTAPKRCIVVESQRRRFEEALIDAISGIRIGHPLDEATQLGPLASLSQRARVQRQVAESVALGARLIAGGSSPLAERGAFFLPTLLTGVDPEHPAAREEVFGPVLSVLVARDEQDAVRLANHTDYGLGATVYSADVARARRVAEALEVGACSINQPLHSDFRIPFGGVKGSGYGRELGEAGLLELTRQMTLTVAPAYA